MKNNYRKKEDVAISALVLVFIIVITIFAWLFIQSDQRFKNMRVMNNNRGFMCLMVCNRVDMNGLDCMDQCLQGL